MSTDGQNLAYTITADDAGATATMQSALSKLVDIDAALLELVHSNTQAKEATSGLNAALTQLEGHAGTVARGFGAMGLGASEAAARVEGLTGALAEMQRAAPELLVVATALSAVIGTFSFFKDGIQNAEGMAESMDRLRAVVDETGGSWSSANEQIQQFIQTEAMATGQTQDQLASALADLAGRIHDVHDAETILRVAEEESIVTGHSLTEITNALLEAEAGRGMSLAQLDPRLKDLIHHNANLSTILKVLHEDNVKAIEDQNNSTIAWERAKEVFEAVGETLGAKLLPAITDIAYTLIGTVDAAHYFGKGVGEMVQGVELEFKSLLDVIVAVAAAMQDVANRKWGSVAGDFARGMSLAGSDFGAASHDIYSGAKVAGHGLFASPNAMGKADAAHAVAAHMAALDNITLDQNPQVGFPKNAKPKQPKAPFDFHEMADGLNQTSSAAHGASQALKAFDDQIAHLPHTVAGYEQAISELKTAITNETADHNELEQKLKTASSAYETAREKANAYGKELNGHANVTAGEKQHLKDLEEAAANARRRYDELSTAVRDNESALQKHKDALAKDEAALNNLQNGFAKFVADSKSNMEQDLLLSKMTDEQKVAYYQQMVDSVTVIDEESLKKKEQYYSEELAAYKSLLAQEQKEREDQQKQLEQLESTFLNDLLEKHQSFHDAFKNIWDDIVKLYIQDLEKMIMESSLFNNIFSKLLPSFGGSSVGGGATSAPGGSGFGSLFGVGVNGASAPVMELGPQTIQMITGSQAGLAVGSVQYNANQYDTDTAAIMNGAETSGSFNGQNVGSGISSNYLQAALMGLAIGGSVGGGNPWSSVFGAIGGTAGLYFGGPAGQMIGSTVGGLFGSLFGNHSNNSTDEPDVYEPTYGTPWNYGQFVVNMNGAPGGFNGQTINPQSPYWTQAGGTSLSTQLEQWLQNPSQGLQSPLTQQQDQLIQQLQALGPNINIASESQGMFTLGDGTQIPVQQFMQLIAAIEQIPGAPGSGFAPTAPVFTLTHLYPNANLTSSNPNIPGQGGGGYRGLGGGPGPREPQGFSYQPGGGQPYINVDMNGATIVGPNGLAEVAQQIATILGRLNNGEIPGSYANSLQSRLLLA